MTETTWEYTIPDISPLFSYSGNGYNSSLSGGPNLAAGWTQTGCARILWACNLASSAHQTTVSGATVSLTFYGQSVRLFGNVTGGMQYMVNLDGVSNFGKPSGQVLVSTSKLTPGYHTIGVTSSPPSDGGILTFQSASVTVGTGLTGAQLIRTTIQDGDASIKYSNTNAEGWIIEAFTTWDIDHTTSNTTWHQLGGPGSYSLDFPGNAIMVYGFSWGGSPSVHKFYLDNDPPRTLFANSSMTNTTYYSPGLAFFRANLSGSSHHLSVTNENGLLGLDYIEFLTITGGTPLRVGSGNSTPTAGHTISPGIIAGAVIGGLVALIAFIVFLKRKSIKAWLKAWRGGTSGVGQPD